MNYWLIKSEPFKYSWEQLESDKKTYWDGVRNYAARNNMRAMKKGDLLFYYHSNEGLNIVGIAQVIKEAYTDPTQDDETWVAVDIKPIVKLQNPVSLADIKNHSVLQKMELVRLSRLSVSKVSQEEFNIIMKLSKTKLPVDRI